MTGDFSGKPAQASLTTLRDKLVPSLAAAVAVPGTQVLVTGPTAGSADFASSMRAHLPWVMAFVLGLTFVVLVFAFRSVVVAGTAVVLNLLSVGAAYGILVLVFQHGFGHQLLGFQSGGVVIDWLPLFLFVVLFGLSMDYHVFVVSRIREAHDSGLPTKVAVARGVTSSAGVVTSAAAVMGGVFSIFGTLSLLEFKQLGVGLAVAVLIDATVVRAVLLPSAMTLLGRRNWWMPAALERRLPAQQQH
jgi:RND superfamily putative drug exporter